MICKQSVTTCANCTNIKLCMSKRRCLLDMRGITNKPTMAEIERLVDQFDSGNKPRQNLRQ